MKRPFIPIALTSAFLFLLQSKAHAAGDEVRVLVIASASGDEVASHLVNELIAIGITAIVTPALEGELAFLARERQVSAAVRVMPSRKSVRMWVRPAQNPGPQASSAEESIDEKTGEIDDPAASLALRTVEILRARLMSAALTQSHPSADPKPLPKPLAEQAPPQQKGPGLPPTSEEPKPSLRKRGDEPKSSDISTSLYIAPAIVLHPGSGLSAGGGTLGGITLMLSPQLGADFMVMAPVAPSTISAAAGTIKISSTSIGIGGWLNVLNIPQPFAFGAGAGIALSFLAFDGEASDPIFQGRDGTVPYALPYARAAFSFRALPRLGIRSDFLAGIAIPRLLIQNDSSPETTVFGRPMLMVSVGLETAFF